MIDLWTRHVDHALPVIAPASDVTSSAQPSASEASHTNPFYDFTNDFNDEGGEATGDSSSSVAAAVGMLAAAASSIDLDVAAEGPVSTKKRVRDEPVASASDSMIGLNGHALTPSYDMKAVPSTVSERLLALTSGAFLSGCNAVHGSLGAALLSSTAWAGWRPATSGAHAKLGSSCLALLSASQDDKYLASIDTYLAPPRVAAGCSFFEALTAIGGAPGMGIVLAGNNKRFLISLPAASDDLGINTLMEEYLHEQEAAGLTIGSESFCYVSVRQPGLTTDASVDAFVTIGGMRLDLISAVCEAGASSSSAAAASQQLLTAMRYRDMVGQAGWLCHDTSSGIVSSTMAASHVAPSTIQLGEVFGGTGGCKILALFFAVRGCLPGGAPMATSGSSSSSSAGTLPPKRARGAVGTSSSSSAAAAAAAGP